MTDNKILSMIVVNSYIFIGTNDSGMFISIDNGVSWTNYHFSNLSAIPKITCFAAKENIIYAGSYYYYSTLLKSTDYGASWNPINYFLSINSIVFDNDNVVISGILRSQQKDVYGVFISSDNGITWLNKSNGLVGGGGPIGYFNNLMVIGAGQGSTACVFFSTNHGENWQYKFCMNNPYTYCSKVLFKGNKIVLFL